MCLYSHHTGIFPSAEMELLPSVFTKYVGLFCTQWGFFLNNNYLFILAVLGFPCCMGFSLVAKSRGCSLVAVHMGFSSRWLLLLQSVVSRVLRLQ